MEGPVAWQVCYMPDHNTNFKTLVIKLDVYKSLKRKLNQKNLTLYGEEALELGTLDCGGCYKIKIINKN